MGSRPDVALVSVYPGEGSRHSGSSGVASYTANLAHALAAEGAGVVVVAPRLDGGPASGDDGPVRVERAFARGPAAGPEAFAAAARAGAPVVHVQHELFLHGLSALPGLLATIGLARRVPRIVTAHQVVEPSSVDGAFTRMHGVRAPAAAARVALAAVQRFLAAVPDATVVHEQAFARHVPGAVVIPHGIETVQRTDRTAARVRLGLPDDRLVTLCFGFVAPYKGLDLACDAAVRAGDLVELVVAGGEHPRLRGSGYLDHLRERTAGRVRFTGFVPEPEIPSLFAAADLALLPYPRPHASSGALALALAHGTPVLCSPALALALGAPALAGPDSPDALAVRLRGLACDPGELEALRDASERLRAGRSWAQVARRHLELYREVIDARAASRRVHVAG